MNISLSLSHFFLFFATFCPILLSSNIAKEYSYIFFLFQLITITVINYRRKYLYFFLSPANLLIYYVVTSFFVASLAFNNGIVFPDDYLITFSNWKHFKINLIYVLITTYSLFYVDYFVSFTYQKNFEINRWKINKGFQIRSLTISTLIFIIFYLTPLSVGAIGGSGDMSYVPKAVAALNIFYLLAINKIKYRFLIYLMIIGFFASFSYSSKREAIFFVFPILLIESIIFSKQIKLKELFSLLGISVVGILLILAMSVMRGYGASGPDDTVDIINLVPRIISYVGMNDFLKYFLLNIEVNYTFFHSFNAMEYIMNDSSMVTYGSTIYKMFFVFFPRSLFSFIKPDSFIHLYTESYNPGLRLAGGSYPPNLYAEMFWNFHFSGFIILNLLFLAFSKIYALTIKHLISGQYFKYSFLLFIYLFLVTYFRGSGLDMFTVYVIFSIVFTSIIYLIAKLFSSKSNYETLES